MLDVLRHWLHRPAPSAVPALLRRWAEVRGMAYRVVRESAGCVLHAPDDAWRLEWGPSQRAYLVGSELRLIAPVHHPPELVMLLLNRLLAEAMERLVYEQYVDSVQTRADADTPAEVRWLVMHERAGNLDLDALRGRYALVASDLAWARQWLRPALRQAWAATVAVQEDDVPLTLTLGRGRLVLRTAMEEPSEARLQTLVAAFAASLEAVHHPA